MEVKWDTGCVCVHTEWSNETNEWEKKLLLSLWECWNECVWADTRALYIAYFKCYFFICTNGPKNVARRAHSNRC